MTDTTDSTSDVAAALDAARANVDILDPTGPIPGVVTVARRDDVEVEVVDLERHLAKPNRQRGAVKALTAEGFIQATTRLASGPDSTQPAVVYANADTCMLEALLNDDHGAQPGWRDMRVVFSPQATPEWKHWTGHQGLGEQQDFAKALEDGETEIRTPSATVMLELAQTFNASSSAKFKQAGRLRDGRTQLVYEEEIEATAGEGLVAIPDVFTIEVRPFYAAAPRLVECRLRYRIDKGELRIGYTIHRPEEIIRESFATDVIAVVREAGLFVLDAVPAGAR